MITVQICTKAAAKEVALAVILLQRHSYEEQLLQISDAIFFFICRPVQVKSQAIRDNLLLHLKSKITNH